MAPDDPSDVTAQQYEARTQALQAVAESGASLEAKTESLIALAEKAAVVRAEQVAHATLEISDAANFEAQLQADSRTKTLAMRTCAGLAVWCAVGLATPPLSVWRYAFVASSLLFAGGLLWLSTRNGD